MARGRVREEVREGDKGEEGEEGEEVQRCIRPVAE
jgi:hypothetical protein